MPTKRSTELCSCGQPLHYPTANYARRARQEVRRFGPTIMWPTLEGTYLVPRHYLYLHCVRPGEFAELAETYGWVRLEDEQRASNG